MLYFPRVFDFRIFVFSSGLNTVFIYSFTMFLKFLVIYLNCWWSFLLSIYIVDEVPWTVYIVPEVPSPMHIDPEVPLCFNIVPAIILSI